MLIALLVDDEHAPLMPMIASEVRVRIGKSAPPRPDTGGDRGCCRSGIRRLRPSRIAHQGWRGLWAALA
jgi:hypothetical protein